MAEETVPPNDPMRGEPISTIDPLFDEVQMDLTRNPEKKAWLKGLFATPLSTKKNTIIAVRSDDVLTTIQQLLQGSVSTEYPQNDQEPIIQKAKGAYYLTPIYCHPYFQSEQGVRLRPEQIPFTEFNQYTYSNAELYAGQIAFYAGLMRNVAPKLLPGWQKKLVNDPESHIEDELHLLYRELQRIKSGNTLTKLTDPNGNTIIHRFLNTLQQGVSKQSVLKFLFDITQERSGVIMGFNQNILQGDVFTDVSIDDPGSIIHDSPEMAIIPPNGMIDLSSAIVAIEPLGEYEDEIISSLFD